MSELLSGKNEELYRALDLEELLHTQDPAEDLSLREGQNSSLRTTEGFLLYFDSRDYDGSPSEGYGTLARDLCGQLDKIAVHLENRFSTPLNLAVRLRPEGVLDQKRFNSLDFEQQTTYLDVISRESNPLYEVEETTASRAFRGAIDTLLHTKDPKISKLWPESIVYSARFHVPSASSDEGAKDVFLWLMETRKLDAVGPYSELELMSHKPAGFEEVLGRADTEEAVKPKSAKELRKLKRLVNRWNPVLDQFLDLKPAPKREVSKKIPKKVTDIGEVEVLIREASTS